MSDPTVRVTFAGVPDEFVMLPEPVNEPMVRFLLARSRVPLLLFSRPEIVVAALRVKPELLSMVRFAGVFCVRPLPVFCDPVPL